MKSNRQTAESFALSSSGAKARGKSEALIAALKRGATQDHSFFAACLAVLLALLLLGSAVAAQKPQDKDADKKPMATASAQPAKKDQKKDQKKDEKKDEPKDKDKEEKKGGMTADTFSGLKFRSIGPAVASGRVMAIAVNPKNRFEYYVGVASGGVWKTVNDGTTWTPVFD